MPRTKAKAGGVLHTSAMLSEYIFVNYCFVSFFIHCYAWHRLIVKPIDNDYQWVWRNIFDNMEACNISLSKIRWSPKFQSWNNFSKTIEELTEKLNQLHSLTQQQTLVTKSKSRRKSPAISRQKQLGEAIETNIA